MRAAETAEEGLRALREDKFDIIISDFRLPGMNGLEFLRSAAAAHPDAVNILITAYRDERLFSEANRLGVSEFLEKPFSVKTFIELLVNSLNKKNGSVTAQNKLN